MKDVHILHVNLSESEYDSLMFITQNKNLVKTNDLLPFYKKFFGSIAVVISFLKPKLLYFYKE